MLIYMPALSFEDVKQAQERIYPKAYRTPLIRLPLEAEVYAKAENLQRTNSFKFRGAYNFLAAMSPESRQRGVCTASSGNHAQALACAAHSFGVAAAIAIPESAPAIKVVRTKAWGAEVVRCGSSGQEREAAANRFVVERAYTLVPPFDHPLIIAGQGSIGLEIAKDMPDLANVLVCTGGGGLLSGIALAIKELCPSAQVIGVEPELAADAQESFDKKLRVTWPAEATNRTIADGVRTQALGHYPFEIIKDYVDGFVSVSEDAILASTKWYLNEARLVVEPTGALSLAAYHKLKAEEDTLRLRPGKTVLVVSGGNIDPGLAMALYQQSLV